MAPTELQAIVRFRFHDGDVEEFKRLSARCMEIVRTQDTGTLQYDTYFNDDESQAIVLERFRDSDALILHGQNMAPLMEAIMATGTVSGELLGAPNEQLRTQLAGSPVGVFALYQAL
jgi:quinol monooxygenase YgiN